MSVNPSVRSAEIVTTLRPQTESPVNPGDLKVNLARKNASLGNAFKPTHTMNWEGKSIILTHTKLEGTDHKQMGHTQAEWEEIASSIGAMLTKKKELQNDFGFTVARLKTDTGQFEYRPSNGNQQGAPNSDNFYDASPQNANVKLAAEKVRNITQTSPGAVIIYARKELEKHHKKNTPPPNPAANPAVPPVSVNPNPNLPPPMIPIEDPPIPADEGNWFQKKFKQVKSWFGF